jgi:hypothetical protein
MVLGGGTGGAGGKGVVILSMPDCKFFRNYNRFSNRIRDGTTKVLTFNGEGVIQHNG